MSEQMEERARRIVQTAIELAEEGGFEAVRLRDVAARAGVALGTLYRRFSSKEDLLVAALANEAADLERRFARKGLTGDTQLERVMSFFRLAVGGLLRRPNLARALLRAAASGEQGLAQKIGSYHAHTERMIVMALRGEVMAIDGELIDPSATEEEAKLAGTLNMIWFALLVGWSGGVVPQGAVLDRMRTSAELILR